jgi:TolA-binding protein
MDEYVSRVEYDERQKRIDDENRRQNHRIDKLETMAEQLADMAASIKVMAVSMQGMQAEQKEQGERLKKIEEEPADKWNALIKTVITVIATAFVTYLLAKGGL